MTFNLDTAEFIGSSKRTRTTNLPDVRLNTEDGRMTFSTRMEDLVGDRSIMYFKNNGDSFFMMVPQGSGQNTFWNRRKNRTTGEYMKRSLNINQRTVVANIARSGYTAFNLTYAGTTDTDHAQFPGQEVYLLQPVTETITIDEVTEEDVTRELAL